MIICTKLCYWRWFQRHFASQKLPFPAHSVERILRTYVERSDWHSGVAIVFELSAAVVIGYWP